MALRYIPLALKHAQGPQIRHFALLTGMEAAVRGTLVSTMPLAIYQVFGDAQDTSLVYLAAGCVSMLWGLLVPSLTRLLSRRWTYTLGALLYVLGAFLAILETPLTRALALLCNVMATATTFVCLNAYVLDYVDRTQLGRSQGLQMAYAAAPWSLGPVLGIWLYGKWPPAPFLLSATFALLLLALFWTLRLGNGRQISRAKSPTINPLAYLGRFFRQPRLIAGWLFAVIRSAGWWIYTIYLPIFCVENGLGDKLGGIAFSLSNTFLFIAPALSRIARRHSVRRSVRFAFATGGCLLLGAGLLSFLPWATVVLCFCASFAFVILDVVGGLPFLMAVKPSERTEMSAVYSSFRDVSGILSPGAAWLVLLVFPLPGIFVAGGLSFIACWLIARGLHPRLGADRPSRGRI